MKVKYPKKLPVNGTIAVTAPASPVDSTKLEKGVSYLQSLGYRVEVGASCYKNHYYVAGTDKERADELTGFFKNSNIDAILCARGGYGTIRLLDQLDFDLIRQNPKLFIGFSDITALQWAIWQQCRLVTISAGMAATDFSSEEINSEFETNFWQLLQHGNCNYELEYQQSTEQHIQGRILPGTLSVAAKLCGSTFLPENDNYIPLLEDVNEPSHKVEGYLLQLRHAHFFKTSPALLTGYFTPSNHEEYSNHPDYQEIIDYVFQDFTFPVITDLPYGHIENKISLPVGAPISLYLGSTSHLNIKDNLFQQ